MRAVFGIAALLIVLMLVGLLASRSLRSTGPAAADAPASASVRERAEAVQERARADVQKALDEGAARRDEALK